MVDLVSLACGWLDKVEGSGSKGFGILAQVQGSSPGCLSCVSGI